MENAIVTGVACPDKTLMTTTLARHHDLVCVMGDTYLDMSGPAAEASNETPSESITRVLGDIAASGRRWLLDLSIDASDTTRWARELIESMLTSNTTCFLFTDGEPRNPYLDVPQGAKLLVVAALIH